jgi:S1-C subfamily serine protease
MRKMYRSFLIVISVLILTACTNYQEIYDQSILDINQSNYSAINLSLDKLIDGDEILYNQLLNEIDDYVFEKFNNFLENNQTTQARDFLNQVNLEFNHFNSIRYAGLEVRLLSAQGNHYDALLYLDSLSIPSQFRVEYDALQKDVLSLLIAELYRYYWDAQSISDFILIEKQLTYTFSLLSEREQYLLAYDLIDLQWHKLNFSLNEIFLDRFVRSVIPQYYDELFDSNDNIEFLSYIPSASEMATFLEPRSAIVEVFDSSGRRLATGSAFFVNDNGLLVTNHHVIDGADRISIITSDGKSHNVTVLLYDERRDVAILKAPIRGNDFVSLGNSYYVQTGDVVYTYGSPLGITNTITAGLVSKSLSIVNGQEFIQLSAPISPGSSGGMLVNEVGELIGITTANLTYGQNMNLAIPINRAIKIINDIDQNVEVYDRGNGHISDITTQTIRSIYRYSYEKTSTQEIFGFLDFDGEYVYAIINYTNGDRFEGEMRDGDYHGIITLLVGDNFYYGQAANGERHGFGVSEFGRGDIYIGQFKNNVRHGQGSYYWGNSLDEEFGHVYIGTYKDGLRTGRGTYLWPNGDIYEGDFVEDVRTGRGIYYYFDGAVYEGSFLDNESNGQGIFYYVNGDVYEGDFVKGDRTGQGTYYNESNGAYYTGGFLMGNFNGFGEYFYSNGVVHRGNFFKGRPSGSGTRTYSNGEFVATWSNWGDAIGIYYFSDGSSERASLINGVWN